MVAPPAVARPPPLRWLGLSRRAACPAPWHDHDCRASHPGVLLYVLVWLLPGFLLLQRWPGSPLFDGILDGPGAAAWLWGWMALEVLLVFLVFGWEWRCTPRGAFLALGNRNVLSLSVAQAVVWTAIVAAATVALLVATGRTDPFDSAGPATSAGPLQTGMSLLTAAGGTLAVSRKAVREPSARALEAAGARLVHDDAGAFVQDAVASHQGPALADGLGSVAQRLPSGTTPSQVAQLATAYTAGLPIEDALRRANLRAAGMDLAALQGALEGIRDGVTARARRTLEQHHHGAVYGNGCPCEARLKDLLQGDEVSNATQLDPNKLQFLTFTLLGLFVYAWTTTQSLLEGGQATAYPSGILATVGLSGLAYVGIKLPIQTPTSVPPDPALPPPGVSGAGVLRRIGRVRP